ncbi:thiol reductase thioredoxin [Sulfodiicoccus acidiphilus]|uniref:Thiol reductase thioredoxin n=1 Tax=Sulfodiicoccus acidiphilus TaxID=1670455 RepID=A0A348B2X9_9CREN|nr:thioredoxin family protein [Sulfodiicoccus acidiphilus]BBD72531.1 thiol reductase thioredoxin [Sulfodiicoccus acidiphilus]GGT93873.1 thiol reductase thioredoxin [Sulfodiicoccus acidiphilus]
MSEAELSELAEALRIKYEQLQEGKPIESATEETIKSVLEGGVTVLAFLAKWCAPCKLYEPSLARVSNKLGEAGFYKIDVDEERELVREYQVNELPTTLVFVKGNLVWREEGAIDEARLEEVVRAALGKQSDE